MFLAAGTGSAYSSWSCSSGDDLKVGGRRPIFLHIGQSLNTGQSYAEVYDPTSNSWASISPADGTAGGTFPLLANPSDDELGPSLRLLDGRIFLTGSTGHTALYDPATNTWAAGPDIKGKLSGHAVLFGTDDAPGAILPNGHVIFAADSGPSPAISTGNAKIGRPVISGLTSTATIQVGWSVTQTSGTGVIPNGAYVVSVDSPTQVHISQNATGTAAGIGLRFGGAYSPPTQLFDFNPTTNTIGPVSPALNDVNLKRDNSYNTSMLILPDGQLLFSDGLGQVWIYTPNGKATATYQPRVKKVVYGGVGIFTLTGVQLNGQSAGAAYGDDEQIPVVFRRAFLAQIAFPVVGGERCHAHRFKAERLLIRVDGQTLVGIPKASPRWCGRCCNPVIRRPDALCVRRFSPASLSSRSARYWSSRDSGTLSSNVPFQVR